MVGLSLFRAGAGFKVSTIRYYRYNFIITVCETKKHFESWLSNQFPQVNICHWKFSHLLLFLPHLASPKRGGTTGYTLHATRYTLYNNLTI